MIKFVNRGLIFSVSSIHMGGQYSFAQSPQALTHQSKIRVYYTSRLKDGENYLSYPFYVDFSPDFEKIITSNPSPVIGLGELGTFDEHGIFPFSPMTYRDKLFAFTTGWSRRISVPVETAVGIVESNDEGVNFVRRHLGPVKSASLKEPFLVGDAFVREFEGSFYMFYIYGTNWLDEMNGEPVARVYKIGMSKSDDLTNWNSENQGGIIPDRIGEFECQALPSVSFYKGLYHMVFCYRSHRGFRTKSNLGYRIGYAWSRDLENWNRDDLQIEILNPDGYTWDSQMQCYPSLFVSGDKMYLLYNGNKFGLEGFGLAECVEYNP